MEDTINGYYLGVRLRGSDKSYYFSCSDNDFALGDLVVVETSAGIDVGKVTVLPAPMASYSSTLELKPISRKATPSDTRDYEEGLEEAKRALEITAIEIKKLNLAMDLVEAFYSLDLTRVTITYTSTEKRVDFRELLKVLAPQLGVRIELRQLASRDKAKMVGGLGICGLPLCCSTFMTQFEGISIQRAKNQMLTLNIPKLSGHCGKLICCLTFEDDMYTEAKKEFPRFGTVVKLDEGPYSVDAFNILSRTVRLVNATHSDYKTVSLEDFRAMEKGTYRRPVEVVKAHDDELPTFDIPGLREEKPANEEKSAQNHGKQNRNHGKNHGRNQGGSPNHESRPQEHQDRQNNHGPRREERKPNNPPQRNEGKPNNENKDRPQQQGGGRGRNRHHHRGHRPNRPNGDNGNKGGAA